MLNIFLAKCDILVDAWANYYVGGFVRNFSAGPVSICVGFVKGHHRLVVGNEDGIKIGDELHWLSFKKLRERKPVMLQGQLPRLLIGMEEDRNIVGCLSVVGYLINPPSPPTSRVKFHVIGVDSNDPR